MRNDKKDVGRLVVIILFLLISFFVLQNRFSPKKELVPAWSERSSQVKELKTADREPLGSRPETVEQVLSEEEVRDLFQETFGRIQGNHSLYYQELSEEEGQLRPAVVIENKQIRAASVIKLFILAALYHQVEEGFLDLDEAHVLTEAEKVGGTGSLQLQVSGTAWTYRQLAHLMIAESDNTASNIIIDRLGGVEATQAIIKEMGYTQTVLNRKFLDMEALTRGIDNVITAEEVGDLLGKMYRRELLSEGASVDMLAQFQGQHYRDKLLADLPSDLMTYNKTGMFEDYGVQSDAAIIVTEKGAFVVVVLSDSGIAQEQNRMLNQFGKDLTNLFIARASE